MTITKDEVSSEARVTGVRFHASVQFTGLVRESIGYKDEAEMTLQDQGVLIEWKGKTTFVPFNNIRYVELE